MFENSNISTLKKEGNKYFARNKDFIVAIGRIILFRIYLEQLK